MTSAKDHGRIALAAIFPNRVDLLTELRKDVTTEHFVDAVHVRFFQLLEYYYNTTGGVLSRQGLDDLLARSNADPGRQALFTEAYEDFLETNVDDADFYWALHELKEDYATANLKDMLTKSMEITVKGVEQKSGEVLQGQEDARAFLLERLANLDLAMNKQDTPHGDMRDEGDLILAEYAERKAAREENRTPGILFGIPDLDHKVGGLQAGELAISAGYASDGKTSLCVQLAWSAAIEQGKNVLFLSTETVNTVIRRKLIARHSRHEKFAEFGLPEGLNSKSLKEGSLTDIEHALFDQVVHDFTTYDDYGTLYIHQVPRMASMEVVEQIMLAQQKKFNIDLVVCDYLALLRPVGARSTDRESLSGILKNAKQISTTFNRGKGVPFISPWQVNRAAKESANSLGQYSSQALAETAEATNTPDVIVSILAPENNTERYADITAQVLKNRDGETANDIHLEVDYATSMFRGKNMLSSFAVPNLGGGTFGSNGLDDLLPTF